MSFLDRMVDTLNQAVFRYPETLAYLESRNVTVEDIKRYRIGYSKVVVVPEEGGDDRKRFMEETKKGRKYEDMIVFPIIDALGQVQGLVGRSYKTKAFKTYITSEVKYNGFFFGFFQALPHIYSENRAFVVEGPFDCNALSHVLPNTVAALTAGLYQNQHEYLKLYCDRIVTVFDSDKAGYEATQRALEYPGTQSMDLGYKDPAECLKQLSEEGFRKYVLRKLADVAPF